MKKLFRISTIPTSLETLLKGQLKMLSEYYEVVAVSSPGEKMKVLEEREGVRTVSIPMERRISLVKDFISLLRDSSLCQGTAGYGTFHYTESRIVVYVGCLDYTGSCPYAYVYGIGISYGYREDAEVADCDGSPDLFLCNAHQSGRGRGKAGFGQLQYYI